MKYYAHINSKNILTGIDTSLLTKDEYGSEDVLNIETTEENFNLTFERGINYFSFDGTNIIVNPDYGEEQKQKRQETFEKEFIETSMKDSHGNNAWYRQVPHGYANAPQTIEIVDKYVRDAQGMTEQIASLLIFYEKPDFAKEEECTEEWLVQHQFNPPSDMTLQQWLAFERDFQIRWANLKYKQQQAQQQ